ncbi:MAG: RNA polymerase sigma factor [Candidatus Latescibacteria bacterium]|nr:RNA polymerase sigma factor [Candidatus Latescibacterota bacterium]
MSQDQPSDAELIEAHRHGSATALMQLWLRYDSLVYGIAHSLVRQREAAEDIRQEVFLKMYQGLARLQDATKFSNWLHTITHNTGKSWLRRQRTTVPVDSLAADEHPTASFAADLEQREQRTALRRMIDQLPVEYRTVVELHYFEGQRIMHIAAFLGLSEATVKWRLYRARDILQRAAKLAGYEVPEQPER